MAHLQYDYTYEQDSTILQNWPVPTDETKTVTLEVIHDGKGRDHHIVAVRWDSNKVSKKELDATVADYKDMYGDID